MTAPHCKLLFPVTVSATKFPQLKGVAAPSVIKTRYTPEVPIAGTFTLKVLLVIVIGAANTLVFALLNTEILVIEESAVHPEPLTVKPAVAAALVGVNSQPPQVIACTELAEKALNKKKLKRLMRRNRVLWMSMVKLLCILA